MLEAPMQCLLILTHAPNARNGNDAARDADWPPGVGRRRVLVGAAALDSAETATTVQVRSGQTLLTDGPVAETKEHLLGYYVIDVLDLDAALAWAAKVQCADRQRRVPPGRRRQRHRVGARLRMRELERAFREQRAVVVAPMARRLGDLSLAEDCVQEAFASAAVASSPDDGRRALGATVAVRWWTG
jgi:hypothetical protein